MKYKQNLHIHTTYADGKDRPEEMVVEAIRKGFDSIGFSEHTYLQNSSFPNQLTTDKMELYKKEIKQLKHQYQDKIDIFCGLEYDFYSEINTDDFDYLIGSVHYLDCNGNIVTFDRGLLETLDYVNANFGGDGLKFAEKYFETVARLPEKNGFDIIGHFDLITKNNEIGKFIDTSSKKYLNYGFEAIHTLNGKIPFFEVNTGAISRGYRTSPYPQMEFLKEFNRCGFGVVITSDCHDKNFLDCNFEETKSMLKSIGFKTFSIIASPTSLANTTAVSIDIEANEL